MKHLPRLNLAGFTATDKGYPLHVHEGTELVYVNEGRCVIRIGELELEGEAGMLFVLPGETPHTVDFDEFTRTTYVDFSFKPDALDDAPRVFSMADDPCVERWMTDLARMYVEMNTENRDTAGYLLLALIGRIGEAESGSGRDRCAHAALERARQFIMQNLSKPLSASEIAARAGVSASHLRALFRERFGCGPVKYQQQLRMDRARKLLHDPYLSVSEVAYNLGYDDPNYFVRLFRQQNGLPPARWRREKRAGSP